MFARIPDALVLKPSTEPIATQRGARETLATPVGPCGLWTHRPEGRAGDVLLLRLPGAGGRAERAIDHPIGFWPHQQVEVWAVNPPGYGDSPGRARLQNLVPVTVALLERAFASGQRRVFLAGNSLGGLAALLAAPRFPLSGLIVRNPPPLRAVIRDRRAWWNGWIGADLIAAMVPGHLDAVRAAAANTAPAVFIRSLRDRVVPAHLQSVILERYGGPSRVLDLPDANHDTPLEPDEAEALAEHLDWLWRRESMESEPGNAAATKSGSAGARSVETP